MANNSKEYNKENYEKYWGSSKAIKARSLRNQARAIMEKRWLVCKWDNLEVDHKNGTTKWNWDANLRVISRLRNRIAWQKKATRSRLVNNKK